MTRARTHTDQEAAPAPDAGFELLVAGRSFARYDIVRCIGVGGMGSVFEATHSLLRKRVALKALHSTLGRSEGARSRFLREAETVARIRHPNVVDISDVGVEQGVPYLVMEFLEGEDLACVLEREGRLSVQRTIDVVLPAVAGLCTVHRLGIVHRDIKPENIFLAVNAYGEVVPKLVDFGVSKDIEASGKSGPVQHTVAGTPHYMSPEQSRGSTVLDARTDQYAFGVLLYQCLTGVRPYDSDSLLELIHQIDAGNCEPLRKHVPDLPAELEAIVLRAMARRIDERFPSTEAFGQALCAFASEPVRAACAREFSGERLPSSVSSTQRDAVVRSDLSAQTLPSDGGPLGNVVVTVSQTPKRSVSGVRARDTGSLLPPNTSVSVSPHAKRAFLYAALLTAVFMAVGVWWLTRDAAVALPTTPAAPAPPFEAKQPAQDAPRVQVPERQAPAAAAAQTGDMATPAVTTQPDAAVKDSKSRPRHKQRTESTPAPAVDIQLSR